jgi:hypothetical protein
MSEKTNYQRKLADPRWQKRKSLIQQRDNFTCQKCADDKTEIHVHHKHYTGEPWDAPDEDLETLCAHCHKAETEVNNLGDTIVFAMKTTSNYLCKTKKGHLILGKFDIDRELEISMVITKPKEFLEILTILSK